MRIYFLSPGRVARFVAFGLVMGFWLAYGVGGLPIEHKLAPLIIVVAALPFIIFVLQAVIITNNGITYLRTGFFEIALEKASYEKIKQVSLRGSRTKVLLWPARSRRDAGVAVDKMLFLEIELVGEKRKKRVPLRLFGSRQREMIVQALLERMESANQ